MIIPTRLKPRPASCAFCGATFDLLRCEWPTERYIKTPISELEPGDKIYRGRPTDHLLKRMKGVVDTAVNKWGCFEVMATFSNGRQMKIWGSVRKRVLAMRPAPCGQWCCPLHRVERGDHVPRSLDGIHSPTYCRDHWMSWQDVA